MTKKDLVKRVSDKTGMKQKQVKFIVESTINEIKDSVANNEKVSFVGFGTFKPQDRAEKKGTDPSNGKAMVIPRTIVPAFKPGQAFKKMVKDKLSK